MSAGPDPRPHSKSFFESLRRSYESFGRAYLVLLLVIIFTTALFFSLDGKLPALVTAIVGSITGLISVLAVFWKYIHIYLNELWHHQSTAVRVGAGFTCFLALIVVIAGILFLPNSTAASTANQAGSSSITNSFAPRTTPTPSPTSMPIPSIPKGSIFRQSAPYCHNPSGTLWSAPLPGTSLACTQAGLIMHPTSYNRFAEVQLDQVYNQPYQLRNVSIQVKLTFQKPTDTKTLAGFFIQTNPPSGKVDQGFSFLLNSAGYWELLHFVGGRFINVVASGLVNINPKEPITMEEKIVSDMLYSSINGQMVNTMSNQTAENPFINQLNGTAGLVVGSSKDTISSVMYSNLSLMS